MKEGYSQIRNEALAYAFSYMNLIEHWGSGIPRIIGRVKALGPAEPEFIGGEVDLRINIYRCQINGTNSLKHSATDTKTAGKLPMTEQEQKIHKFALENGSITTAQVTELLGVKQRRARDILGKMVDNYWLRKEGVSRSTVYVINTDRE